MPIVAEIKIKEIINLSDEAVGKRDLLLLYLFFLNV